MSKEELIKLKFKEFSPGYLINENGIVYSVKSNKYLSSSTNMNGYTVTTICQNGKRKKIYNHIKVVEMFGDRNNNHIYPGLTNLLSHGISIDHIDMDKTNCKKKNLELVAHSLNCYRRSNFATDDELDF